MKYTEDIVNAVREAGLIMTGAHDIAQKITVKEGAANYVTAYDVAVEEFLYDKLGKLFPTARFIGEESSENHTELLASGLSFIIDPIDGTTNFIHGFRHSAISVGLCSNGEIVAGVIYDPYQDEMFYAEKGEGAYLNGERIHVSDRDISNALVSFGTSPYHRELADETFEHVKKLYLISHDIRRCGAASLDLAYVACGRCDLFYEITLSPWDYAAGLVIVKEAGGIVTSFEKTEVTLDRNSSVVAGNPITYRQYFEL